MINKINVLGIIGVGLIGGSFSLALKQAGKVTKVLGAEQDKNNAVQALALGVVDEVTSIAEMAAQADVIVLATPVKAFTSVLQALVPHLSAHTIVSDVGSTKAELIRQARELFGDKIHQFVPAHPIAGSHNSGPTAATADLFQGKNVILTPLLENKPEDIALIQKLWIACGAHVQLLDEAREHDNIFAAVSHFPHFLASSYMSFMLADPVRRQALGMGGTGFRDFTRIAGGSPEVWRDIFMSNQEAILGQMDAFEQEIKKIRTWLEQKDSDKIYDWLDQTSQARKAWKATPIN